MDGFLNVSAMLGPCVYALLAKGEVVYVGRSRVGVSRIYSHLACANAKRRGKRPWYNHRAFRFDAVWIKPCTVDDLVRVEHEMILRYVPKYNANGIGGFINAPVELNIRGVKIVLNAPRAPQSAPFAIERRL